VGVAAISNDASRLDLTDLGHQPSHRYQSPIKTSITETPMDSSSIELPGSEIERITLQDGCLRIHFSRAYIVKTMTGSTERTRWWQAGDLVMDEAEVEGELPDGPFVCDGGDVDENIYTYRDMIPIPLDSRGYARCMLKVRGSDARVVASGTTIRLEMDATPKYIEHLRD
jgi:hypothetical protein